MMKKVNKLWMLLCLYMVWMMTMNVSAEEYHIYDHADLLTVQEEEYLENLVTEREEQWDMNFLVVTIDDAQGKSAMEYADDFYDIQFPEDQERYEDFMFVCRYVAKSTGKICFVPQYFYCYTLLNLLHQ